MEAVYRNNKRRQDYQIDRYRKKNQGGQSIDFTGKTAISTGAAGMGLLFAQNFAELGGNVVFCDVNKEALNKCAEEINAKGKGKAIGVICDVRDYEQVCSARDKAIESFGSIDITCNFAGGAAVGMQKVDSEKYPEFPDVPIDVYDWYG